MHTHQVAQSLVKLLGGAFLISKRFERGRVLFTVAITHVHARTFVAVQEWVLFHALLGIHSGDELTGLLVIKTEANRMLRLDRRDGTFLLLRLLSLVAIVHLGVAVGVVAIIRAAVFGVND